MARGRMRRQPSLARQDAESGAERLRLDAVGEALREVHVGSPRMGAHRAVGVIQRQHVVGEQRPAPAQQLDCQRRLTRSAWPGDRDHSIGRVDHAGMKGLIPAHHADVREHLADQRSLPVDTCLIGSADERLALRIEPEAGPVAVGEEQILGDPLLDRQIAPIAESSLPHGRAVRAAPSALQLLRRRQLQLERRKLPRLARDHAGERERGVQPQAKGEIAHIHRLHKLRAGGNSSPAAPCRAEAEGRRRDCSRGRFAPASKSPPGVYLRRWDLDLCRRTIFLMQVW